jgi:hypothetical protein
VPDRSPRGDTTRSGFIAGARGWRPSSLNSPLDALGELCMSCDQSWRPTHPLPLRRPCMWRRSAGVTRGPSPPPWSPSGVVATCTLSTSSARPRRRDIHGSSRPNVEGMTQHVETFPDGARPVQHSILVRLSTWGALTLYPVTASPVAVLSWKAEQKAIGALSSTDSRSFAIPAVYRPIALRHLGGE